MGVSVGNVWVRSFFGPPFAIRDALCFVRRLGPAPRIAAKAGSLRFRRIDRSVGGVVQSALSSTSQELVASGDAIAPRGVGDLPLK